jgi:hypothetical protein
VCCVSEVIYVSPHLLLANITEGFPPPLQRA